jgi:hypothetical protein
MPNTLSIRTIAVCVGIRPFTGKRIATALLASNDKKAFGTGPSFLLCCSQYKTGMAQLTYGEIHPRIARGVRSPVAQTKSSARAPGR